MSAVDEPRVNVVWKSINKRLTYCGIDRPLFWLVVTGGLAMWNMFNSLIGAIVFTAVLIVAGRHATRTDPEILRIIARASRFRGRYDPMKYVAPAVRVVRRC